MLYTPEVIRVSGDTSLWLINRPPFTIKPCVDNISIHAALRTFWRNSATFNSTSTMFLCCFIQFFLYLCIASRKDFFSIYFWVHLFSEYWQILKGIWNLKVNSHCWISCSFIVPLEFLVWLSGLGCNKDRLVSVNQTCSDLKIKQSEHILRRYEQPYIKHKWGSCHAKACRWAKYNGWLHHETNQKARAHE